MSVLIVTSTIENTWSTWGTLRGYFNLSIVASTLWVGTISVQRKFGVDDTSLRYVAAKSSSLEEVGYEPEADVYYRCGVLTGNYTAGKARIRLSQ